MLSHKKKDAKMSKKYNVLIVLRTGKDEASGKENVVNDRIYMTNLRHS